MGFFDRIGRVFEALDNQGIYGADAFSRSGVAEGKHVLQDAGNHAWFDPVVPDRRGEPFSLPAVIWAEGSVFAVDFRRWKGRVDFAAVFEDVPVTRKFLFWEYQSTERQAVGIDTSRVVKAKEGNYGEDTFYTEFRHPIRRARAFTMALKHHLGARDERWRRLFIYPVVAFAGADVDITSIESFDEGVVRLEDLPDLVQYRRNERFAARPARWIVEGLSALPTWDRLVTRTGAVFQGQVQERTLGISTANGDAVLRFAEVERIEISRDGRFSDRDNVVARTRDGAEIQGWCTGKAITLLERGTLTEHRVRNLTAIEVGMSAHPTWQSA